MNDGKEHRYTADELREIVKERRARSRDEDERNAKMCAEEVIDNLNSKMRRAAENGDTSVESSINIISSVYRKQCPAKIFLEETCDILDRYFAARGFVVPEIKTPYYYVSWSYEGVPAPRINSEGHPDPSLEAILNVENPVNLVHAEETDPVCSQDVQGPDEYDRVTFEQLTIENL